MEWSLRPLDSFKTFPDIGNKPKPKNTTFHGCPPEGDGGDPDLNRLKNRIDTATWIPMPFDRVLELSWPKDIERRRRANWSDDDTAQIDKYEGTPISIEGYLALAKKSGAESCNCGSTDDDMVDFHVHLTKTKGEDRTDSIVVEPTPRTRAKHAGWTLKNLRKVVKNEERVRISGWLMFDQEHPDHIPKHIRGTIWEIHPVMEIEVKQGNQWVALDDFEWDVANAKWADSAVADLEAAVDPDPPEDESEEGDDF